MQSNRIIFLLYFDGYFKYHFKKRDGLDSHLEYNFNKNFIYFFICNDDVNKFFQNKKKKIQFNIPFVSTLEYNKINFHKTWKILKIKFYCF